MTKYVTAAADRHGRVRHRFRLNGVTKYLPGEPGSDAFEQAYKECLESAGAALTTPRPIKVDKDAGTVGALILEFRQTGRYRALRPHTKATYEYAFAAFNEKFGKARIESIDIKFVMRMVDGLKATPGKANQFLRVLKLLMNYAIRRGDLVSNPTDRVQPLRIGEYATWTEEDILSFKDRWPLGTTERRIFSVALGTGQRASDLIMMTTADIKGGFITVKQSKTGSVLSIPIIKDLAADLAAFPPKGEHIIHRRDGKAFTRSGITHLLKDALREAKLPDDRNLHGLRKATCRRLAEVGASEREIMAISGHKSPSMVSKYVVAANQKTMATSAMARLDKIDPMSNR